MNSVIYSAQAKQDLRNIYEHIAYILCSPDTAKIQVRKIMGAIKLLDEMPLRHRLYDNEPWHSQGLRFFPVDNYIIFYLYNEFSNTVIIVRIMYGRQESKKYF
ncbi:type II toxin-antitoxin system RelE/ParE family toxin [Sedimentibacter sp.]|uniref:type II toxin-antitoxin system RelE/ParE family toxin n=1 Tax=Sedimentibacter sp. TaxID=1960295 RepID=UPI0028AE3D13|nr:type II toxin-antitoxin system RelE/ParE family toxin [Sedimentibacter sp.]